MRDGPLLGGEGVAPQGSWLCLTVEPGASPRHSWERQPKGWRIFKRLGASCIHKTQVRCLLGKKLLESANRKLASVFLQIPPVTVCPRTVLLERAVAHAAPIA